jgi:glycerophosphoryl diester phosphodiesterase
MRVLAGAWQRSAGRRPLVLGHRGARHAAPENTLAAFELALAEGAEGVELDVRLDRDGEVVVIHDCTLRRVSGGRETRPVWELGRADLDRIDLGGGERVPRLTAVLDWARARRARVNVEVKHDGPRTWELVRRVAALCRGMPHAERRLLLSCFHPGVVAALARIAGELPVAWLVHREQRWRGAPG